MLLNAYTRICVKPSRVAQKIKSKYTVGYTFTDDETKEKFKVVECYKNHVVCKNVKYGYLESFNNIDLWIKDGEKGNDWL